MNKGDRGRSKKILQSTIKQTNGGTRYKALGNSMAVPVMAWIGKRIQMVEDIIAEKAA